VHIVDRGSGVAVVMLPGIQGRWEWMTPAVDALAKSCRLITFSLCDEPSSGFPVDHARGVENYLDQLETVFHRLALSEAVLIGVSYAGPIAMEFAVRHPDRVRGLLLVSALPPDWQPDRRARFYLRAPRLFSPVFFVDAPLRAQREVRAALPTIAEQLRFSIGQTTRLFQAFLSPSRMATRLQWLGQFQFSDPSGFRKPTMVVTGEPGLDRVVRPELTRRYLDALPGARYAMIPRTGHLGSLTRPTAFAEIVHRFVDEISDDFHRASA
jgi:pimeloyl-ACP methyl ester carboxylesterase